MSQPLPSKGLSDILSFCMKAGSHLTHRQAVTSASHAEKPTVLPTGSDLLLQVKCLYQFIIIGAVPIMFGQGPAKMALSQA